jgi:pilus assembly protein CpaD
MSISVSKLAIVSALAMSVAACGSAFNGPEHALSVAETHPISVDSQIVTLTIDADPTTTDLSDMDKARLRAFANAYLTSGHGPLTITVPSGHADADGHEAAADIRKALNDAGVPWETLSGATYRTGGDAGDQLIVSYTHYVATPSECGVWKGVTARDYRNIRTPNFGCATQNNIAAMLADPHDLIAPATLAPRDAMASTRGVAAYRGGETTSSAAEEIEAQVAQ